MTPDCGVIVIEAESKYQKQKKNPERNEGAAGSLFYSY